MAKCKETKKLEDKIKLEKKKVSNKKPNTKGDKYIVIKDNVFISGKVYNYGDIIYLENNNGLYGLVTRKK